MSLLTEDGSEGGCTALRPVSVERERVTGLEGGGGEDGGEGGISDVDGGDGELGATGESKAVEESTAAFANR